MNSESLSKLGTFFHLCIALLFLPVYLITILTFSILNIIMYLIMLFVHFIIDIITNLFWIPIRIWLIILNGHLKTIRPFQLTFVSTWLFIYNEKVVS